MAEEINHERRRFIGAAAMVMAAARLSMTGSEQVQADKTRSAALPAIKLGTNGSFGSLKQIDADGF